MPYLWSDHALHIQTLFRPWAPGDGYAEDLIAAAEQRLGLALPRRLRAFYHDWGRREEMLGWRHGLAHPDVLEIKSDALVIAFAHQSVWWWAIPLDQLANDDPPVYAAPPDWVEVSASPHSGRDSRWEAYITAWQPSHDHLSGFLDGLIYTNAFCGGTGYFGWANKVLQDEDFVLIKRHWQEMLLPSYEMEFSPDWVNMQRAEGLIDYLWIIHRAPGIALWLAKPLSSIERMHVGNRCIVAVASSSNLLDDAAHILGVEWSRR